MSMEEKERRTGELFSELWQNYSSDSFKKTVELFAKRFEVNGFDLEYFKNKHCLDVGCGSGRYSLAMAELGAKEVVGVDIGEDGINYARKMCNGRKNLSFKVASILEIPFDDNMFEFICCSGVIMHTKNPQKALEEIYRVLKKGGYAYFLVYGAQGISWDLVIKLREICSSLGFDFLCNLMKAHGLDVNKRKHLLDNYFVPLIDFYTWAQISKLFKNVGFKRIKRWEKGQFDHESSFDKYIDDLIIQRNLFDPETVQMETSNLQRELLSKAFNCCTEAVNTCKLIMEDYDKNYISQEIAKYEIYGFGNHRIVAEK